MINSRSERKDWIDVAKGIGILSMVIGHYCGSLTPIIYSFHMPLFFILTGFTIKKVEKGRWRETIIKDFKRLIIPCFIVHLIILLGNCIINKTPILEETISRILSLCWGNHWGGLLGGGLPWVGRIWFLIALFWTRIIYRISLKCNNKRLLVFLLLAPISMYIGMCGYVLPQNMDLIFVCLLFVEIGYILKKVDFYKIPVWFYFGLFVTWIYLSNSKGIWISMNTRSYPGYGLCILVAVAGCICVIMTSRFIEKMKISKILIFYGKNSMILLMIQSIVPYFGTPKNNAQIIVEIIAECLLVVVCAYIIHAIKLKKMKKDSAI